MEKKLATKTHYILIVLKLVKNANPQNLIFEHFNILKI